MRTPFSAGWEAFKVSANQCEKCAASKQALLNEKTDANKWEPVDNPDAWIEADAAIIAAHRAKK